MPMILLATLAAGLFPATQGAGAATVRRPDLVVTAGSIRGSNQVIVGRVPERFSWNHRTKNLGNATARASRTAVVFDGGGTWVRGPALFVPRLAPGASRAGNGGFTLNFDVFEWGTYRTRICADVTEVVRESKESNNCRRIDPTYVIPSRLVGRITGNHPLWPGGSVKVTWATDAEYEFSRWSFGTGDGLTVDYLLREPSVTFRVQGTDPMGCTWSANQAYEPPLQGIRLQFGPKHRYRAESLISSSFHFPLTRTCNGMPADIDFYPASQLLTKWFDTHGWRSFQDPGLEALRGTYIDNVTTTKPFTYSWNLDAPN
jgi:hypothetical protein